jgi:threonine/homoserine/homoserine lactone efflux protein
MSFNQFIAYFSILIIATITPGPSMLLAVSHGANYGIKKTFSSCLGNLIGNLLMAFLSIAGLGAILIVSGLVFNIIKWIGVLYLIFIGIKIFLEPVIRNESEKITSMETKKSVTKLFIDGFIVAVGNPKGILFFTALFPQFTNIKSISVSDLSIIFVSLGIVAYGCYMLYAVFGSRINKLLHLYTFRKIYNRVTGSIFIGTGLALAFTKNK